MRVSGTATEHEVVAAFLAAEMDSPRWPLADWVTAEGRRVVLAPDVTDADQNAFRALLLGAFRGWKQDAALFRGFPDDVVWYRGTLTAAELGDVLYARDAEWVALSSRTRRVRDGADSVRRMPAAPGVANVVAVAARVRHGDVFPPLLVACEALETTPYVLVEGHTRATAYVLEMDVDEEVPILLGVSANMSSWLYFQAST